MHAFLDEVYRIDDFFKSKQSELINNFINLQDKFRIRTEKYEMGSTKTRSQRGKKGTRNTNDSQMVNETNQSLQGMDFNSSVLSL